MPPRARSTCHLLRAVLLSFCVCLILLLISILLWPFVPAADCLRDYDKWITTRVSICNVCHLLRAAMRASHAGARLITPIPDFGSVYLFSYNTIFAHNKFLKNAEVTQLDNCCPARISNFQVFNFHNFQNSLVADGPINSLWCCKMVSRNLTLISVTVVVDNVARFQELHYSIFRKWPSPQWWSLLNGFHG